jgi:hypothetical protein
VNKCESPRCSMYGIFTYKTGWFLGQNLENIPYIEHMGYRNSMYIRVFTWFPERARGTIQILVQGNVSQRSVNAQIYRPGTDLSDVCQMGEWYGKDPQEKIWVSSCHWSGRGLPWRILHLGMWDVPPKKNDPNGLTDAPRWTKNVLFVSGNRWTEDDFF